MKKKLCLLSLLIVACSAGCIGRAIREGYYGAKGASGRARPIQLVTANLADYDAVVVEPFSDDSQGLGNEAFMAVLPAKITEQIIQKTYLRYQGSKVLRITGKLILYDTGTTRDKITGPREQAVCRVKLIDAASGDVLGEASCDSQAKSSIRKGPEELAEGMGKVIAEWIIEHDSRGARPEEKD